MERNRQGREEMKAGAGMEHGCKESGIQDYPVNGRYFHITLRRMHACAAILGGLCIMDILKADCGAEHASPDSFFTRCLFPMRFFVIQDGYSEPFNFHFSAIPLTTAFFMSCQPSNFFFMPASPTYKFLNIKYICGAGHPQGNNVPKKQKTA